MLAKKKPCDGEGCNGRLAYIWKNETENGVRKRYCQACWGYKSQASKPTVKRQALKRTQTPIKKFSDKQAKKEAVYKVMRKIFLEQHPMCELAVKGICQGVATEIQHCKGRGTYFLDTTTWKSADRACHHYADTHPEEAFQMGWAEPRLTEKQNNDPI